MFSQFTTNDGRRKSGKFKQMPSAIVPQKLLKPTEQVVNKAVLGLCKLGHMVLNKGSD